MRSFAAAPALSLMNWFRYAGSTVVGFLLFYFWPRKTIVSVISAQRSGSTLLKALLAEAPDVSHLPEVHFTAKMNRYRFYYHAFKKSTKRIIVLKDPALFTETDYPKHVYSYVRFIILYRAIKTWLGSVRRALRSSGWNDFEQKTTDEQFFKMWLDTYEGVLERVVKSGLTYAAVSYEELICSPEEVTARLLKFTGSARSAGTSTYSKPADFDWRWGSDDGGDKIRQLRVIADEEVLPVSQGPGGLPARLADKYESILNQLETLSREGKVQ